ncbi:hypothetical protein DIPPA_26481 [Diplonema papillatum]|nr:hypothetical protein DIPPA_26481 [Diplonema papillatum]
MPLNGSRYRYEPPYRIPAVTEPRSAMRSTSQARGHNRVSGGSAGGDRKKFGKWEAYDSEELPSVDRRESTRTAQNGAPPLHGNVKVPPVDYPTQYNAYAKVSPKPQNRKFKSPPFDPETRSHSSPLHTPGPPLHPAPRRDTCIPVVPSYTFVQGTPTTRNYINAAQPAPGVFYANEAQSEKRALRTSAADFSRQTTYRVEQPLPAVGQPSNPPGLSVIEIISKVNPEAPRLLRVTLKGNLSRLPMKAVKASLEAATGVPMDRQVLEKDGFYINDDLTGASVHLRDGSVLTMRLAGPPALTELLASHDVAVNDPASYQASYAPSHPNALDPYSGAAPAETRTFHYHPPQPIFSEQHLSPRRL